MRLKDINGEIKKAMKKMRKIYERICLYAKMSLYYGFSISLFLFYLCLTAAFFQAPMELYQGNAVEIESLFKPIVIPGILLLWLCLFIPACFLPGLITLFTGYRDSDVEQYQFSNLLKYKHEKMFLRTYIGASLRYGVRITAVALVSGIVGGLAGILIAWFKSSGPTGILSLLYLKRLLVFSICLMPVGLIIALFEMIRNKEQ